MAPSPVVQAGQQSARAQLRAQRIKLSVTALVVGATQLGVPAAAASIAATEGWTVLLVAVVVVGGVGVLGGPTALLSTWRRLVRPGARRTRQWTVLVAVAGLELGLAAVALWLLGGTGWLPGGALLVAAVFAGVAAEDIRPAVPPLRALGACRWCGRTIDLYRLAEHETCGSQRR